VSGMVPAVGGGHWVWGARRVLPEGADVLLARLDEAGTVLFARSYGGTEPDFLNFRTLDDGGLIGGGFTRSFGANDWDAWIVRLDGAGDIVWQKALDGGEYDYLAPPRPASDGGFILVGETRSFGEPDGWLVKLSDAGELVWQRRYDMRDYDRLSSIVPVPGGYVAAGYTTDSSSNQDGWLIGVSSTGQFMWSRTYGGDGADLLGPVGNLADGGLLLRGTTSSAGAGGTDAWLMRLSPVGEILSSRTYGTGELDYFAWPRLQNDGSLLVAGYTVDETTGKEDVLLARIAATGEVEWAHAFGDPDLRDWALSWRSGWVAATTETWGAGDDDLLLLRPLPDGTCPGLELRDVALQVDTFYPAVRSHVLVASDTNAAIRDTDAVPVELTLTQESVF
ncbi:MAG: hypothetical protein JW940_06105, partial [Polyangiaceae bacterium]|nr:hypothetical protein [Polyangiaceae bacterium]